MHSCNISIQWLNELPVVNWGTFLNRMHKRWQVAKSHCEPEAGIYLAFIQMPEIQIGLPSFPLLLHVSSFSFSTLKYSFWWTRPRDLPFLKWSTRIHRPFIWPSLVWIAIISPNTPAAPVSPGPSVPVAVVRSGSSVPAAGTSSGIGALANSSLPSLPTQTCWGKLTSASGSGPVTSFDLQNYTHKGLSPSACGLLFGFWSLILQI